MRRQDELLAAARAGDIDGLRRLISGSEEPMALDLGPGAEARETPLMAAAAAGQQAAVAWLLEAGADPSRRDAQGRSAADLAREAGHAALASKLDLPTDQEKVVW
jgi:hypothetical protein